MRCDSYAAGNCTIGACELADWIPDGLGDGGDWAQNAPSHGLTVTDVPTVASVVCYCRGNGYSEFGHVGFVEDVYADGTFLVKEMNFTAFGAYDERVSSQWDVCGFILAPGASPGRGAPGAGPPAGSAAWDVAHEWDKMRWYLATGTNLSLRHLQDLVSWFNGVGRF